MLSFKPLATKTAGLVLCNDVSLLRDERLQPGDVCASCHLL